LISAESASCIAQTAINKINYLKSKCVTLNLYEILSSVKWQFCDVQI